MTNIVDITNRVFHYFEQLSKIPRGSGNMKKIADFCVGFAKENNLRFVRDELDSIIIYKDATPDKKGTAPIILQGHLDMVCQKTKDSKIDFETDGISLIYDGDFLRAENTTLGADNGIAVAMIFAILESDKLSHPPIEAVLTTDEETGMFGANALDMSLLEGKRMINLDSEEDDTITVSCAGGVEVKATLQKKCETKKGTKAKIVIKGLRGGHSGVDINKCRINANRLAGRILNHLKAETAFDIIGVVGGDKANAIANLCEIEICLEKRNDFGKNAEEYLKEIKNELIANEPDLSFEFALMEEGEFTVLCDEIGEKLITILLCVPDGVVRMSAVIENLVETSLNLGILEDGEESITFAHALRSNKKSAIFALKEKLCRFYSALGLETEISGFYPPWEYKENSRIRDIYVETYTEHFGKSPKVEALHAGLECAVFAAKKDDLDCIAVGPTLYDVHTVNEKMSIPSSKEIFALLLKVLEKLD